MLLWPLLSLICLTRSNFVTLRVFNVHIKLINAYSWLVSVVPQISRTSCSTLDMHCVALKGPMLNLSQLDLSEQPLFLGGIGAHGWHQDCIAVHVICLLNIRLLSVVYHLHSCLRPFLTDTLNRHGSFPSLAVLIIMTTLFASNRLLLAAQGWLGWLVLILQTEAIISVFLLGLWRSRRLLHGFNWVDVQNWWLSFCPWPTLLV